MYEITVVGMVQGIGFRPFVYRLATKMGLDGSVRNSGGIVKIDIMTETEGALKEFISALRLCCPKGSVIQEIQVQKCENEGIYHPFQIITSDRKGADRTPFLPADLAICDDCRKELTTPKDRRFRYPFISCIACGPRYSIMDVLPYDRDNIVMKKYQMCPTCQEEYTGLGRRKHAQTISCKDCGPQLLVYEQESICENSGMGLERLIHYLQNGRVVALKGIGGYQLCCLASNSDAVMAIRKIKQREKKPFAVMFRDKEQILEYCEMDEIERKTVESSAAPIVLLKKKSNGKQFPLEVSGESRVVGAFLPYTGLHQLLLQECEPLIMTSANRTGEPIITEDEKMQDLIQDEESIAIGYHTREIRTPLDDSLLREMAGDMVMIRRSRGYVPMPLDLKWRGIENSKNSNTTLAYGGDLKATFAFFDGKAVYPSQYFGDLEHLVIREAYEENIDRMEGLLGIVPEILLCDLHPGYFSHQMAMERASKTGISIKMIQHHKAHVASVMAEENLRNCIGVAMDGTGYGTDGAIWGCEFFYCNISSDASRFERRGYLKYAELIGGDESAKDALKTLLCQLDQSDIENEFTAKKENIILKAALKNHINTTKSSSMGRLFDTVSAFLGIRDRNSYEGECAIALENAAHMAKQKGLPPIKLTFPIKNENGMFIAERFELLRQIDNQLKKSHQDESVLQLAAGFHEAVAEMILHMCQAIREQTGESKVALSGGVFGNVLLLERTKILLEENDFIVYNNRQMPANDGDIALGQIWLAEHQMIE